MSGEKRRRGVPAIEFATEFFEQGNTIYDPEDSNYGNFAFAEE